MAKKDGSDDSFEPSKINYIEERNLLLQDVPYVNVKKAWFALSHLLVRDGAVVVDMGCGNGQMAYAMAALCPKAKFIGVDKSKKTIQEAQKTYELPNLEFKVGDVSGDLFEPESIDFIINSMTLHEIFSDARYNERIVNDTLRKQFEMLRNDGVMYIHDYAKPAHDEYVLIEMRDKTSRGDALADLSEVDLLVWYSEHAQPKQDPGCGGFFLEELPPRFPKTRLFRLPYKWAYEFIMRKDKREIWEDELPYEYTFYTVDEFRKEITSLGARMEYSAPHWDDEHIRRHFDGHFRLLNQNGDTIGDPPTSFIAIARKQPERSSLSVRERRISDEGSGMLQIKTLRDQKNGDLQDVVTRGREMVEIIPYHKDDEGRLYIYLHEGIVRGISNAVSRSGVNIDGREWSGHMLEPIATDFSAVQNLGEINVKNTDAFAKNYIGLTPERGAMLEAGTHYYPDPNYIDERIHTYFMNVQKSDKDIPPKKLILEQHRFHAKGYIRAFNAQTVLDAVAVGVVPNSRLELQILSLMQHLNVRAENWISKDISIAVGEITQQFDVREFLRQAQHSDKRFKEVKGSAGQLRTVNSIFVEEGFSQGGRAGLSSEHLDFVLSDEKTINTAVILPITKSMRGDLHAGVIIKNMPILQRYEGQSMNVSVPSFNIPKNIVNYRMLKQFIAEKFGVTPNMVIKLGESYFSHVGITPQRIHPFAVAAPPASFKDPDTKFLPFYQYMLLWMKLSKDQSLMTVIARSYRYLPEHVGLQAKRDVYKKLENIFKAEKPDWSLPGAIDPAQGGSSGGRRVRDDSDPNLAADPAKEDSAKVREKKRKDKRRKRKLGLREGHDVKSSAESVENLDDPDSLEEKNQDSKNNKKDLSLIEEFKREIDEIKKVINEEAPEPDNKPKPEDW